MFASPGPILVQLGPFSVRWYGITTAIALVVALWLLDRQARVEGLPPDDVIGARPGGRYRLYRRAAVRVAFNWTTTADTGTRFPRCGKGASPFTRPHRWRDRRRRGRRASRPARPANARSRGAGRRRGAGHRSLGEFFQRGGVRPTTISRGGSTYRRSAGPSSSRAPSASTRPSSMNPCGTSWFSPCSCGGSGHDGTTGRAGCSSGISACIRWGGCASRP